MPQKVFLPKRIINWDLKKDLASESKHSGPLKKHKNMAKGNPSSSII
jgi:hypothetical protein